MQEGSVRQACSCESGCLPGPSTEAAAKVLQSVLEKLFLWIVRACVDVLIYICVWVSLI